MVINIQQKRKIKFALTSSVATIADHLLFILLIYLDFKIVVSNFLSQFVGMIINFALQKQFVFELKRKQSVAFAISLCFSIIGLFLGSLLIKILSTLPIFFQYPYLAKIIVTGIIFFYNFYTKRIAFEKK